MSTPPLLLDGSPLTASDVESVAVSDRPVALCPDALRRVRATRTALEEAARDGEPHYGINTGFGSFSRERIAPQDLRDLQRNLIRSHAAGVGDPLPRDAVRAMIVVLTASLARGRSGVRAELVERLAQMLNGGVTPVVPEVGSVGASGDLAPLAHAALVLIGEGVATRRDRTIAGGDAMRDAGVEPISLEAKEGLALINGTHLMAGRFALALRRFERLADAAVVATAMSIDACKATDAFLDARIYGARNQPGPAEVAARIRGLLRGSGILPSHASADDPRVQDPYSLRCAPIVLGSALDAARSATGALERELGAVTDNPLVFREDDGTEIISAGNFHGMPIAIPLDILALATAHVAGVSERRTYHMISARDPETGLRPFLSPKPGLHSGLMIAQYAAAACCNEIIGLAAPASVSNLPTSAGMEDYNSFGPRSAAKLDRSVSLARRVVAIELVCGAPSARVAPPAPVRRGC